MPLPFFGKQRSKKSKSETAEESSSQISSRQSSSDPPSFEGMSGGSLSRSVGSASEGGGASAHTPSATANQNGSTSSRQQLTGHRRSSTEVSSDAQRRAATASSLDHHPPASSSAPPEHQPTRTHRRVQTDPPGFRACNQLPPTTSRPRQHNNRQQQQPRHEQSAPPDLGPSPNYNNSNSAPDLSALPDVFSQSPAAAAAPAPMPPAPQEDQEQQQETPPPPPSVPTRPGAYWVTKTRPPGTVTYKAIVPPDCPPGGQFTVQAENRQVQVRCPPGCVEGQELEINVPHASIFHYKALKGAQLTASPAARHAHTFHQRSLGGARPMLPDIERINDEAVRTGGTARTYIIEIPQDVAPGQSFAAHAGGVRFKVTCPAGVAPGQCIRIAPPAVQPAREETPLQQTFAVQIPTGVRPGGCFAFTVGTHSEQQVLVECPPNCVPGDTLHVSLETSTVADNIQLEYHSQDKSGWRRTVRANDLKFQWVRLSQSSQQENATICLDDGSAAHGVTFDFWKSAHVRKMTPLEGNDPRVRTAKVEFLPATQVVVDSKLRTQDGRKLFSYADIALQQGKPLSEKHEWFLDICKKRSEAAREDPQSGNAFCKLLVRREHLLNDSVKAIMCLGEEEMQSEWRFEFVNEPAIDESGVTKEWFELVTAKVFDPAIGLFLPSKSNQAAVEVNPASGTSNPDSYLLSFRFIGRVLGRALCDGQLVKGHLVRLLYKHLLGWPITFEDVRDLDEDYFKSLRGLTQLEDVSELCLDFTTTEEAFGAKTERNLCAGGRCKEVTNDNLAEYLAANIRYRMFDRTLPQLTELLLGFYDVVPEPALTIFDAGELELILCGLPEIDLADWRANTLYTGLFESGGENEVTISWFWEVVEEFTTEMRARLLQFVTATSGVPAQGFAFLKGNDEIKMFTIQGVDAETCLYPRAHTCFNRIDLPKYSSKEDLKERLTFSITSAYVGFGIE